MDSLGDGERRGALPFSGRAGSTRLWREPLFGMVLFMWNRGCEGGQTMGCACAGILAVLFADCTSRSGDHSRDSAILRLLLFKVSDILYTHGRVASWRISHHVGRA